MEKSFWHETGNGHPRRSHAQHSIVIPNAFSFDTPQCLIRPRSNRRLMLSTARSKSSRVPRSNHFIIRFFPSGAKVGVDMRGQSRLGQWIWYRSMYSHCMRSMLLRQLHSQISAS